MKKTNTIISLIVILLLLVLAIGYIYTIKKDNTNKQLDENNFKACTLEYMPVCGIDGITYGNRCSADKMEIAYDGECGNIDAAFTIPKVCTKEYMPVCGADNITYSNKCMAGKMKIISQGVC